MADNESFFIHCGIYLILEKLKIIAYRNLLLKTHQIPIDAFLVALKYMGVSAEAVVGINVTN